MAPVVHPWPDLSRFGRIVILEASAIFKFLRFSSRAHNPKAGGSNPSPATLKGPVNRKVGRAFAFRKCSRFSVARSESVGAKSEHVRQRSGGGHAFAVDLRNSCPKARHDLQIRTAHLQRVRRPLQRLIEVAFSLGKNNARPSTVAVACLAFEAALSLMRYSNRRTIISTTPKRFARRVRRSASRRWCARRCSKRRAPRSPSLSKE